MACTDAVVTYTAICGGYENNRTDIRVFGDAVTDKFKDPVMNAKIYKVLPHQYLAAPTRIWVDGNIYPSPNKDAATTVKELLGDFDIAVFAHPWRGCIYDEVGHARLRLPPCQQPIIDAQVAHYRAAGMPMGFGLAECGVILSHDNAATREFFTRWWAEITRYTQRDQISFPYVWWQMGTRIRIRLVGPYPTRFGAWFRWFAHK